MKDTIVRLFRRETTSKEFIPVIDGLRFLAIFMVVMYHGNAFIREKSAVSFAAKGISTSSGPYDVFVFGHQGVQLFFVISGFILAVPFLRFYLGLSDRKPMLRAYFLRRLTRLEPPYIVSTLLIFVLVVYVGRTGLTFSQLTTSLAASLLYLHNLVFPGTPAWINSVTWSLEVEVQYYILAPFIIGLLCLFKEKIARRTFTALLILFCAVLAWVLDTLIVVTFISLLTYMQYFLAGILLCDIILLDAGRLKRLDGVWFFLLGAVLLGLIVGTEHSFAPGLAMRLLSPAMIFGFYLLVFGNSWWRRFFSLNALTLIGGMCYSIYLLHYVIISAVGRLTIERFGAGGNFTVYYIVQMTILVAAVLAVASVFFLLIEKPCMKRDWHVRLGAYLKSFFAVRRDAPAE